MISGILRKVGLTKNYPPFHKTKMGFTPPRIKRTPHFIKRPTGENANPKLIKLIYKSEKPFMNKAFLLWAILKIAPRATLGRTRFTRGDRPPRQYKIPQPVLRGGYEGSITKVKYELRELHRAN